MSDPYLAAERWRTLALFELGVLIGLALKWLGVLP